MTRREILIRELVAMQPDGRTPEQIIAAITPTTAEITAAKAAMTPNAAKALARRFADKAHRMMVAAISNGTATTEAELKAIVAAMA